MVLTAARGGMVLNKKIQNFFLFSVSAGLAVLAVELYLRWNPPVQVYMATRDIIQHEISEISPDPLTLYLPRAGLVKRFSNREFNTAVKINSVNMRDREYPLKKPDGVKRIAVMGDSFVFGWGVEHKEIFTEILENKYLERTEVLNFGVSGYQAYQELQRLKKEALKFQPEIVFFFLYGIPEGYWGDGPVYPDEKLTFKKKFIAFLEKQSYFFVLLQEARGVLRVTKSSVQEAASFPYEIDVNKGWEILSDLKRLSLENRFEPLVVYIPLKQYARAGSEPDSQRVAEQCLSRGIPFLDLTKPLHDFWIKENKSPYFRIDDHWNRDGHRVAAAALNDYLTGLDFASKSALPPKNS